MFKSKYGNDDVKKNIKLVYSGDIPQQALNLIDKKDVTDKLGERELLVSINYSGTEAGKVSYSTEGDTFYLKIGPVPKDFDTNRIKAKITGFEFDLVITIGARDLVDLGPIYNNLRYEINKANKINLDVSNVNKRFGMVNIVDTEVDSLSTLVFQRASDWKLIPNKKAAQALLVGMTYKNGNHS